MCEKKSVLFYIVLGWLVLAGGDLVSNYGYSPWIPQSINRTDLVCPIYCSQLDPARTTQTKEHCCVCNSQTRWQLFQSTKTLQIEYTSRFGLAEILDIQKNLLQDLSLVHQNGFLSKLPNNICKFVSIVKIDLSQNFISSIANISCLVKLDTMDLSYNRIRNINNNSFIGLTHLRFLKLTNNNLQTLEPFAITGENLHLFKADFSHNSLIELDVSNMVPENNFCKYDFRNNLISQLGNRGNFALNPQKTYKGGNIDLSGNKFTKFLKFEHFGVTDIKILGKLFDFGFIMKDVHWDCDCQLVEFLEMAEHDIERFWRDYFNMTCSTPLKLRGRSIPQMVLNKELDKFICNLTMSDKCPQRCYCFHQPHLRRTVVNCTGSHLTKWPPVLPESTNLTLIFNDNLMHLLENKEYLKNGTSLHLAHNHITEINSSSIQNLRNYTQIDFSNNMIKSLPREIGILNPCKIVFGNLTIDCDCSSMWIRDWLQNHRTSRKCKSKNNIKCRTEHGIIPAENLSKSHVCGNEVFGVSSKVATGLGVLTSIAILMSSLIYFFRYEIYLLKRYLITKKSQKVGSIPKYDAFISLNDENDEIRSWALTKLVKYLEKVGYKIYISCRDSKPGMLKEPELSENVACSKNFIIILSECYFCEDSSWTVLEWKYIWHFYRGGIDRNIMVINFDHLESSECRDLRIRAFLRLNLDIDFSNRRHKIIKQIREKLGIPVCRPLLDE